MHPAQGSNTQQGCNITDLEPGTRPCWEGTGLGVALISHGDVSENEGRCYLIRFDIVKVDEF